MKKLLIDSSSLISLSSNCLLGIIESLKQNTGVQFLITEFIKEEIISKALKIDRFMLSGIRLSKMLDEGIIKLVDVDYAKANKLLKIANSIFLVSGNPIKLIHKGEAQAMVAAVDCGCNAMVVDERILSTLINDPYTLKLIIESRLHDKVTVSERDLIRFKSIIGDFTIIKSSDLIAIAYEKGLLKELALSGDDKQLLKASLLSLKYAGCAISLNDINEYLTYSIKP